MIYLDTVDKQPYLGIQLKNNSLTYLHWTKDKPVSGVRLYCPKKFMHKINKTKVYCPIGPTMLVEWLDD